jgi:hypothetical protein
MALKWAIFSHNSIQPETKHNIVVLNNAGFLLAVPGGPLPVSANGHAVRNTPV